LGSGGQLTHLRKCKCPGRRVVLQIAVAVAGSGLDGGSSEGGARVRGAEFVGRRGREREFAVVFVVREIPATRRRARDLDPVVREVGIRAVCEGDIFA